MLLGPLVHNKQILFQSCCCLLTVKAGEQSSLVLLLRVYWADGVHMCVSGSGECGWIWLVERFLQNLSLRSGLLHVVLCFSSSLVTSGCFLCCLTPSSSCLLAASSPLILWTVCFVNRSEGGRQHKHDMWFCFLCSPPDGGNLLIINFETTHWLKT